MYRFAWHLLSPVRRLLSWLAKECIRLFILFVIVVALYFVFFSGKAGAQEPDFTFGKSVSLAGFRPIHGPDGWDNSCSQYVVASLLSAIGTKVDEALYDEIGQAINPDQTGAFSWDIESYLKKRFHCERRSPATIDDIVEHLNRGLPVVTSVRANATDWHLIIVVGYSANSEGEITELTIADNGAIRGEYSPEKFANLWSPKDSTAQTYCFLISPSELTPAPKPLIVEDNVEPSSPVTPDASPGFLATAYANIHAFRKKHFTVLHAEETTTELDSNGEATVGKFHRFLEAMFLKPVARIGAVTSISNSVEEIAELVSTVVFAAKLLVCVVTALVTYRVCICSLRTNRGAATSPLYLC